MIRRILRTRKRRVLSAAVTIGLVASIAFAAWLTEGTGPARGQVGSLTALVVTATPNQGTSTCFPGGDCAGYLYVTNPAENPSLELTTASDAAGAFVSGACPAANLSVNAAVPVVRESDGQPVTLASGDTAEVRATDLFHLAAAAPNQCQGVSFSKDVTVAATTP